MEFLKLCTKCVTRPEIRQHSRLTEPYESIAVDIDEPLLNDKRGALVS